MYDIYAYCGGNSKVTLEQLKLQRKTLESSIFGRQLMCAMQKKTTALMGAMTHINTHTHTRKKIGLDQ